MSKSDLPLRYAIKPKGTRNAILIGIGCIIFTVGGLWMMFSGEGEREFLVGLICVFFFGGVGLSSVHKIMTRKISMVLTYDGIEQHTIYGRAFIPWKDIEDIGHTSTGVYILLKSYDGYLANMTLELAENLQKMLPAMKITTKAVSFVRTMNIPLLLELWSQLQVPGTVEDALERFGEVGKLAEIMLWSRETYGYDLFLSWVDLDRSGEEFASFLKTYQHQALYEKTA